MSTRVISWHGVILMLSANVIVKSLQCHWTEIVMGFILLSDRLTAQRNHDFLEAVLPWLLDDAPVAPVYLGKCCGSSTTDRRKVGWTSRTSRLPCLTQMCSCGDTWRRTFIQPRRGPSKTSWRNLSSCGRDDDGRCERMRTCLRRDHSIQWRVAHCRLPWYERRPLLTPIVTAVTAMRPWLDHLIGCAIWQWHVAWKLNVTGHVLYSIFDFLFNGESYYGKFVREFISCGVYVGTFM